MAALSADKKNCEAAASASLVTLLLKRCAYAAPRAPRRLTRRRASAMLVAHTIARHTQRQSQSRAAHTQARQNEGAVPDQARGTQRRARQRKQRAPGGGAWSGAEGGGGGGTPPRQPGGGGRIVASLSPPPAAARRRPAFARRARAGAAPRVAQASRLSRQPAPAVRRARAGSATPHDERPWTSLWPRRLAATATNAVAVAERCGCHTPFSGQARRSNQK